MLLSRSTPTASCSQGDPTHESTGTGSPQWFRILIQDPQVHIAVRIFRVPASRLLLVPVPRGVLLMSLRALDYPVVRVLSWSERRLGPSHEQQCALCRKPRGLGMVPGNLATVRNVGRRHLRPGWPRRGSRHPIIMFLFRSIWRDEGQRRQGEAELRSWSDR